MMVSSLTMGSMIVQAIFSLVILISFWVFTRRKGYLSHRSLWIGVLVFIVFSQILENTLHSFMFSHPTTSTWLKEPIYLAIYGALAAGVFEEIGRYVGFKFFLKKNRKRKDGISFGLGHGGIEVLLFGCFTAIQAFVLSVLINTGQFEQLATSYPQLSQVKTTLLQTPFYLYLIAGLERFFALCIQIALSLAVLYSVRYNKIAYLGLAIFLHTFIDFFVGLYQGKYFNLFVLEGMIAVVGILALVWISRSKRWFELEREGV